MRAVLRHLSSFAAPTTMGFILPYLIVRAEHANGSSGITASSAGEWYPPLDTRVYQPLIIK